MNLENVKIKRNTLDNSSKNYTLYMGGQLIDTVKSSCDSFGLNDLYASKKVKSFFKNLPIADFNKIDIIDID